MGPPEDGQPPRSRAGTAGTGFEESDLLGMNAGSFRLMEVIGRGAFGVVYRGEHPGGLTAAVKVLGRRSHDDEAELLARLRHDNLVSVHDVGLLRDRAGHERLYIAMEMMPSGATLAEYVRSQGCDWRECVRLVREAARGVSYMHNRGVWHHDIKPDNILVTAQGRAKVADLGLAQRKIDAGPRRVGGTPAYQSPEQCVRHSEELSDASDVYALGVTLFELLSGKLPVFVPNSSSPEERYSAKLARPPASQSLPATVPHAIRSVVERAMAGEPGDRYPDVAQFEAALERAVRRASRWTRWPVDGWCLLYRARPVLASVLAVAVLAGALGTLLAAPLRHATAWERAVFGAVPGLASAIRHDRQELRDVKIVRIPAAAEIERLAERRGVEGVSASSPTTWRALWPVVLEDLARAGARVVVLDLWFTASTPFDAAFADAIERVQASGTPVVLGANTWQVDTRNKPAMADALWLSGTRWGVIGLDVLDRWPVLPILCQPPDGPAVPSLALAAVAAAEQANALPRYELRDGDVVVQYLAPTEHPVERQRLSQVSRLSPARLANVEDGLQPRDYYGRGGDWQVAYHLPIDFDIQAIDRASIDLAEFLLADKATRRSLVEGAIVVLFDPQRDRARFDLADVRPSHAGARPVIGGEVHAVAIQSLLDGRHIRFSGVLAHFLVAMLAAFLGATLALPMARVVRGRLRALAILAGGVAVLAATHTMTLVAVVASDALISPIPLALAGLLAYGAMLLVGRRITFARGAPAGGPRTVSPMFPTWLPGTRSINRSDPGPQTRAVREHIARRIRRQDHPPR